MTALLLSEVFPPKTGGSGRWFWEVYRRLRRDRVVIAAGEHSGDGEFDRAHDLRVIRLPLSLRSWGLLNWAAVRQYSRLIGCIGHLAGEHGIEALHCGRCLPEGLIGLALKMWQGLPYLCYVHGEELNYAYFSREIRWLMRRVFQQARFVIANSRNTERMLRQEWGFPSGKVKVLHPGVDTERFAPAAGDALVRAALGWDTRPVILTVGRLQKRKGHDQLILALHAIRQFVPNVLYAIIGDGEERAPLEALVAKERLAEYVQFRGESHDEELIRCYQQCDLFVLPNRQVGKDIEGFGMVLLEAQACGKPVIAGASGGTAEAICIPESGCTVSCEGAEALGHLVSKFLADPTLLVRMGQAGRQWVTDHFDWKALSRQAEVFFQRIHHRTRNI